MESWPEIVKDLQQEQILLLNWYPLFPFIHNFPATQKTISASVQATAYCREEKELIMHAVTPSLRRVTSLEITILQNVWGRTDWVGCQFTRYDESPREKSPPAVPKVRDIGNTSKPTVHKMKREKRLNFGGSQTKSQEKNKQKKKEQKISTNTRTYCPRKRKKKKLTWMV